MVREIKLEILFIVYFTLCCGYNVIIIRNVTSSHCMAIIALYLIATNEERQYYYPC